jgi:hypothetical protein
MAVDKRIDQLAAAVPVLADLMAIWDESTTGTKKITLAQLISLLNTNSGITTIYVTATDSNVVADARMVDRDVKLVLRGGIGSGEVITTGSPINDQLLFNSGAGTLEAAYNFADGEQLTIMLQ